MQFRALSYIWQTTTAKPMEIDIAHRVLLCVNRLHDNPVFGLAVSELMLVNLYGGDIQVRSPMDSSEDNAAADTLLKYHPVTLRMFSPRAVLGDGNCCYRAVSMAMYGDQRHHLHVRLLAAVEMIKHPEEYDVSDQDYVGQIDVSTLYVGPYKELYLLFY